MFLLPRAVANSIVGRGNGFAPQLCCCRQGGYYCKMRKSKNDLGGKFVTRVPAGLTADRASHQAQVQVNCNHLMMCGHDNPLAQLRCRPPRANAWVIRTASACRVCILLREAIFYYIIYLSRRDGLELFVDQPLVWCPRCAPLETVSPAFTLLPPTSREPYSHSHRCDRK